MGLFAVYLWRALGERILHVLTGVLPRVLLYFERRDGARAVLGGAVAFAHPLSARSVKGGINNKRARICANARRECGSESRRVAADPKKARKRR